MVLNLIDLTKRLKRDVRYAIRSRIADRRVAYALAHKSARRTGRVSQAARARIERLQKDSGAPLIDVSGEVRRASRLAAIVENNRKKNESKTWGR